MIFEAGQRIVFIGDSITDCGRRDVNAPFGNGYASLVRAFVTARYPESGLGWENRGISGNTVRDLRDRWEADAVALRPDWLSVMIGINDIGRAFQGQPHLAVPIDEYEETLRRLSTRAVDVTGCRLILAEPYLIEADRAEPQRAETDRYGAVVRRVADELGARCVRTQEAFDSVLSSTPAKEWADDRVHPGLAGHAVIAQAYLRTIGYELG
jgi:lysophospholipase L1-like esterase